MIFPVRNIPLELDEISDKIFWEFGLAMTGKYEWQTDLIG